MKICIYTDTHFCQYSSIVRSRGVKYSKRLENEIQSIDWAEQLALDKGCEQVIMLGDFFDRADLNSEEISALKDIKWNNLPHKFLVGNHELGSADSEFNSLNALSKIGKIINKPDMEFGDGYAILYLPYILESERRSVNSYITEIMAGTFVTDEARNSIILSHNDISGIQYGKYISQSGFDLSELSACDICINGHLHNQTFLNERVLNLGNLTGQNFSEDAEKFSHCAAILDTRTCKVELINNPYALNFYKLQFNNEEEMTEKLKKLSSTNAVITLTVPSSLAAKAKELLIENNVVDYRVLTLKEEVNSEVWNNNTLVNVSDHISKFKEYILEQLGSSDIILEELQEIE